MFGERTAGAAFAVFAASYPKRVASLVWNRAVATKRWSPEYPWGLKPDEHREEAAETLTAGSGFSFDEMGGHVLKGVPDRWQLYRVAPES